MEQLSGVVLYVEDNKSNLELVSMVFDSMSDVKLLTAIDAETGIEIARTEKPDLILMDLNLPGMS
ncbi:MAG: response regulator, partial [Proteobacteria bacterium]|nr:response regulator [Pseudomonadota bacterium]